eukprot:126966-Pyramimonas_sp.AAC.1
MADYMIRPNRTLREQLERHKIVPWDEYVLLLGHRWAGHVARMQAYGPSRIAALAFSFKDYAYLQFLERTLWSQGHHYNFHVWWWEKQFYQYFGADWKTFARDSERWKDTERDW